MKSVQIEAINLVPKVASYRHYDNRAYRLISGSAQTRLLETFLALKIPELLIVRGAMPANKLCEELGLDLTRGWKFLHALHLIGLLDQKPYLQSPSPSFSEADSEVKSEPNTSVIATAPPPVLTLSDDSTLFDLSADSKYFFFGTDGGYYFRDLIAFQKYVTEIPGVSFVEVLKGAKIPVMPVWPPQTEWAAQHLEKWMTVTAQGAIKTIMASKAMEGVKTLLDVGGGDGSISIHLVKEYPELHATVFNLPASASLARQNVMDHYCVDKVDVLEGDFLKDEFTTRVMATVIGTQSAAAVDVVKKGAVEDGDKIVSADEEDKVLYDRIMFSRVLTDWTPKVCAMLFQKVRRALAPNGRLVINEAFFEGNEDYCVAWEYRYIFYDTFGRELFKPMEYYKKLLEENGFNIVKISPMIDDAFYSVIEAEVV